MGGCSNCLLPQHSGFCSNWEQFNCRKKAQKAQMKFLNSCQSMKFVSGFFLVLLFLGALFWAKEQDPFSRKWFMLKSADRGSLKCVAVLSKPLGQFPVVIYAHGSGGTLMNDGNDLRQIAELGLAVVRFEYDQRSEERREAKEKRAV